MIKLNYCIFYITIDLEELQELFPKWNFFNIDTSIWVDTGKVRYKFLESPKIDKLTDLYNSINYVIEFLLMNGFKYYCCNYYCIHFGLRIEIFIGIDYYRIYYIGNEFIGINYSFNEFLEKIKELIKYDNPFKKVQNE